MCHKQQSQTQPMTLGERKQGDVPLKYQFFMCSLSVMASFFFPKKNNVRPRNNLTVQHVSLPSKHLDSTVNSGTAVKLPRNLKVGTINQTVYFTTWSICPHKMHSINNYNQITLLKCSEFELPKNVVLHRLCVSLSIIAN